MRARSFVAFSIVTLCALPTLACKHSDKAADCERLVPAVREKSEEMRTIMTNAQPNAEVMEANAKAIEASAALIGAMPLKDGAVKNYALQYQLALLADAKLVRDLGKVNPDLTAAPTEAARLQVSSASLLMDDATLVATITEFCH